MPNHIHWLFNYNRLGLSNPSLKNNFNNKNHYSGGLDNPPLEKIIKGFKGYTAKKIINSMKINKDKNLEYLVLISERKNNHYHSLWQPKFHSKRFNSHNELINKIDYIKQNPIRKNLKNYKYIYVK